MKWVIDWTDKGDIRVAYHTPKHDGNGHITLEQTDVCSIVIDAVTESEAIKKFAEKLTAWELKE